MWTARPLSWALTPVLLVLACVPSLNPLHTDADLVDTPWIEGAWRVPSEGPDEIWTFTPTDARGVYRLRHVDSDGEEAAFVVHTLTLDGHAFVNLRVDEDGEATHLNDLLALTLLAGNVFGRIRPDGEGFEMGLLDADWMAERLERGEVELDHQYWGETLALTASTESLQAFARARAEDEEAWAWSTFGRDGSGRNGS